MEVELTAKIAVTAANYAIDKPYTYLAPSELAEQIMPGMRVMVPFGTGNRQVEGLVLSIGHDPLPEGYTIKPVTALLDDEPVVDENGLRLALWMHDRLYCTVCEAVRAMIPAGLYFALKNQCVLAEGIEKEAAYACAGASKGAKKLLDILYANKGGIALEDLRTAFGTQNPTPAIKRLQDAGVVTLDTSAARNIGDKTEQYASLAVPSEEAFRLVEPLRGRYPARFSVVKLLSGLGSLPAKEVCYFTGASRNTLKSMEKRGILSLTKQEIFRRPKLEAGEPMPPPQLNPEQDAAFEGLDTLRRQSKSSCALLYGVTGSGKTQVYIQLIHRCLADGQSAIVLVPEIALTPQLVRLFTAQFGQTVAVLHSMLSTGERYDEWKRVRSGQARVVVGTRSAVFAPVQNLGVMILDEEQEYSYKSEQSPRYHARDMAKYRCVQENALLVLGSATPSIETMFFAKAGKYHLFELKKRYNQQSMPGVLLADLKEELRSGNPGILSATLKGEMEENLARGEQTILFINRRGSNPTAVCSQCGETPTCDRCSVNLTYHQDNRRLMCHYCGRSRAMPERCPSCGGEISFLGIGTQRVEEELKKTYPSAQVLRMDTDTISARNTHEMILRKFEQEKIPFLVGTQMVTKGLDFENVTLVGVISADQSLYVDDFRAPERTFSLITQVVGRAGRGKRSGRAVIQTCTPKNDVIMCAARQDYDQFYEGEVQMRQLRGYPPFRDMYRITFIGEEESAVLRASIRMRDGAVQWKNLPALANLNLTVLGPAAANVVKVNNRYRYHLTVSGESSPDLRYMLAQLLKAAHEDKLNRGVSVAIDWNPLD